MTPEQRALEKCLDQIVAANQDALRALDNGDIPAARAAIERGLAAKVPVVR